MLRKRWREALRCRRAGGSCKPPTAAALKRRGGERAKKGRTVILSGMDVCPAKAGMFSGSQSHRGNNQKSRSLDSRREGNRMLEAYRQSLHVPSPFLGSSLSEAPSLHRHYPASPLLRASPPPCRPKLALTGSRLARARHRQGFPCWCCLPLGYMPPSIPRRNRPVLALLASRPLAAFPDLSAGRLPRCPSRGMLNV